MLLKIGVVFKKNIFEVSLSACPAMKIIVVYITDNVVFVIKEKRTAKTGRTKVKNEVVEGAVLGEGFCPV